MGYVIGVIVVLPAFILWCYGVAGAALWTYRRIGGYAFLVFPVGFFGAPYIIADAVADPEGPGVFSIMRPDSLVILLWIVATLAIGAAQFWRGHLWKTF